MSRWGKCLCISLHVCNAVLGKSFDGATRNLPANLCGSPLLELSLPVKLTVPLSARSLFHPSVCLAILTVPLESLSPLEPSGGHVEAIEAGSHSVLCSLMEYFSHR